MTNDEPTPTSQRGGQGRRTIERQPPPPLPPNLRLRTAPHETVAGVLIGCIRRELWRVGERLSIGHISVPEVLLGAVLRAGADAVNLLGPNAVAETLVLLCCAHKDNPNLVRVVDDMQMLLQLKRHRSGAPPYEPDALRALMFRAFSQDPILFVRCQQEIDLNPNLCPDASEDTARLCLDLELRLELLSQPTVSQFTAKVEQERHGDRR